MKTTSLFEGPRWHLRILHLTIFCMVALLVTQLNGEPISGKFNVTSDKPDIKSMDFHDDGTVDVTSSTNTYELRAGKYNLVVKKETVRASYVAMSMNDAIKIFATDPPNTILPKLANYKEKNYEQTISITLKNDPLNLFVIKGKEIISLDEGHIYKKTWW